MAVLAGATVMVVLTALPELNQRPGAARQGHDQHEREFEPSRSGFLPFNWELITKAVGFKLLDVTCQSFGHMLRS